LNTVPNAKVLYTWLPSGINGDSLIVSANTTVPTQSVAATVTLMITDSDNTCQASTVVPVYQNIYMPNASIFGPSSGVCQPTVVLTNISSSTIPPSMFSATAPVVALLWEGPSPQPSLALSSSYTAQTSGVYTMTARDNNNGCVKTATYLVTMGPVAAFTHTVSSGTAVFTNVSTGTDSNTAYFWDFGDGNTSTLEHPSHTYSNGGAHLVKLKVMNQGVKCVDSLILSVTASGVPCAANSNFSLVPTNTAQVWNVIPAYPWNVTAASWSWGDGSVSNTLYTSHQYSAAGMYTICLSVTVSCVASSSTCTSYSVYRATQAALIVEIHVVSPDLVSGFADAPAAGTFSWKVMPNPNNGSFRLDVNNLPSADAKLLIHDLSGRVVDEKVLHPTSELNFQQTGSLAPGMYFVTLETGGQRYTQRMVVNP
jgi:PKD repeat protein